MSAKKPTKPSKASLNRREALKAQRLAEARRKKTNRIIAVIAGVVALAVLVSVIVWVINRTPDTPPTTDVPTSTSNDQVMPPDGDVQRAWITVPGGTPKAGALIVDIQFDYQCSHCGRIEVMYAPSFDALNERGDIILRNHTRTFMDNMIGNDSSERAAIAAACVNVADRTKYAAYHNILFANQPQGGTGYTDNQLTVEYPTAVGLAGDAYNNFSTCYANRATRQFVQDVEANNIIAKTNASPPNAYLFGGKEANKDDDQGRCSGVPNSEVGACGTPDFYSQGVRFSWADLVDTDFKTMKVDSSNPDALLAFLQQTAQS